MWIRNLAILTALGLSLSASAARAGTIVSTVNGLPSWSVTAGGIVTVDNVITFGSTAVGGVGACLELSFDLTSIVGAGALGSAGGANVGPSGWIPFLGAHTCPGGFCENFIFSGDLAGFGQAFPDGATFALASMVIDTTGAAPGSYQVGVVFSASGPDFIGAISTVIVSGEYNLVAATINVVPEPGTAAMLGLGPGAPRHRRAAALVSGTLVWQDTPRALGRPGRSSFRGPAGAGSTPARRLCAPPASPASIEVHLDTSFRGAAAIAA